MALADESGLNRNYAEAAGLPPTSTLQVLDAEKASLNKLQTMLEATTLARFSMRDELLWNLCARYIQVIRTVFER
jgi:hypothetical protein